MKNKLYILMLLILPVLFVQCQKDETVGIGEEVNVTFTARISDVQFNTKALGDGSKVNTLSVGLFDEDNIMVWRKDGIGISTSQKAEVNVPMFKGKTYSVVFWAQYSGSSAFNTERLDAIEIDYNTITGYTTVEHLDAFHCVKSGVTSSTTGGNVSLIRPFTQLNMAVPVSLLNEAEAAGYKVSKAKLSVKDVQSTFNALTGKTTGEGEDFTFEFTDFPDDNIEIDGEDYKYLATTYLFANDITGTLEVYKEGEQEAFSTKEFVAEDVEPNTKTNLFGNVIQIPILKWDGTTDENGVEFKEGKCHIYTPAGLAWLIDNPDKYQDASGTEFILEKSMDMEAGELAPFELPQGAIFNGKGNTLQNIASTGNSVFTGGNNLTINDLILNTVQISTSTGHIGALVNELKGGGSFINVKVKNSELNTTNGAAGGFVGYIVKNTSKSRDESYTVTFDGCSIEGTTISGTHNDGVYVGLMSGYDNNETLKFINGCSASSNTLEDSNSPYIEGNEGKWLADNDYTPFNGWLGDEENYRGTVMYGDNRFIPCWDGSTTVTPLIEGTTNLIYSAYDLASIQRTKTGTIKLMENVDMGESNTFTAINSLEVLEGNKKTIYNIKGSSLINSASGLEVKELTVSNITINQTSSTDELQYIGSIVDTLKGGGSFINVKVKNSQLYTDKGASGGFVGYIVKNTPKARNESYTVTFDGCSIEGTTISGTLNSGVYVGLMSGYDNKETLIFTNCSASTNTLEDSNSPYIEGNEAVWLAGNEYSSYDKWLGNETYCRGKIYFGGNSETANRYIRKWDGTTTVEPLLANTEYDGSDVSAGTNKFVVYSPFDLAGIRKTTASPTAIYLRADIDMNGQGADDKFNVPENFTQSVSSSDDDNNFNPFSYCTTLDGKKNDTENYSIYNLSISQIEQERAAFILYASGTTVHKNINFRNCQTVAVHKPVATDAKAYGAILVSNVDATYTMENVHAYDCKVFALQKVGTLGARISGTSTLKNNSVNNCYVENYECNISERFSSGKKTIGSWTVTVYADFFPYGEVGGMYGFIQGNSSISDCQVNGSEIYAFGQDDKMATVDGSFLAKLGIAALGYYKVPGRHVSTFIGNIRATGTVTITGSTVDNNTKCTKRHDKHNSTYNSIGQAYIVKFVDSEGSVTVNGQKLTIADCNQYTKR